MVIRPLLIQTTCIHCIYLFLDLLVSLTPNTLTSLVTLRKVLHSYKQHKTHLCLHLLIWVEKLQHGTLATSCHQLWPSAPAGAPGPEAGQDVAPKTAQPATHPLHFVYSMFGLCLFQMSIFLLIQIKEMPWQKIKINWTSFISLEMLLLLYVLFWFSECYR